MIESGRIEAAKSSVGSGTSLAQSAGTVSAGGPETFPSAFPMVVGAIDSLGSAITLVCDVLSQVVEELNKLTARPSGPDPDAAKFSGIDTAIAELKADFAKLVPQPPQGADPHEVQEPDMHQVRLDNVKSDMDELRAEIAKFDDLRGDVEQAMATVHSDMEALRNQFRVDMEALRSQVIAG
jgi:hypothetical protein